VGNPQWRNAPQMLPRRAGIRRFPRTLRRDLIAPKVAEHKGRIVKTTGDGLLVEFQSVVEAVACAVALQRDIPTRNDATGEDERIQFRIGINPGDVTPLPPAFSTCA
jgi:class 3 adenylate cyclase